MFLNKESINSKKSLLKCCGGIVETFKHRLGAAVGVMRKAAEDWERQHISKRKKDPHCWALPVTLKNMMQHWVQVMKASTIQAII